MSIELQEFANLKFLSLAAVLNLFPTNGHSEKSAAKLYGRKKWRLTA